MIRLHITTEGQTEMEFVRKILAPHLGNFHVFADARCVLTGSNARLSRVYRGGMTGYCRVRSDILTWMKEDNHPECRFSTMFDLYRLPRDFPGTTQASKFRDPYERVRWFEKAMREDLPDNRFIPYIQLHGFEALILSDPQKLDIEFLEHDRKIRNLVRMVEGLNPELIDEGPDSSPSIRILKEIPEYNKRTAGVSTTREIGLDRIRQMCPHFNEWLSGLEQLPAICE